MQMNELKQLSKDMTNLQHKTYSSIGSYVLAKIGKWQVEGYIDKFQDFRIVVSDEWQTDYPIHYGNGKVAFDFNWDSNSEIVRIVSQLYKENDIQ